MKSRRRSAFTLVEILMAVALLGAVLLALNLFVFSMGELWGRNSEQRLFDQHVRAVTRHVDSLLRRAVLAGPGVANTAAIGPERIRADTGASTQLLTFELPAGDRTLPWPEEPLPDVVCSLEARAGRGLVLYWHSRLETRFDDDPPRALVLSQFGAGLTYDFYDPVGKTWRSTPQLERDAQGKWPTPDRLTLRFVHGKMTAESSLVLPVASAALPAF